MKVRRRYLALKIELKGNFSSRQIFNVIWNSVLQLYGEYGLSKTGLTFIDYHEKEKIMIIRTVHTAVDNVRAALASITNIDGEPAAIHVLKVSGTLKALRKNLKLSQA